MLLAIIDPLIDSALNEDLAGGDLTTEATVPAEITTTARAIAKSPLVACGFTVFERTFHRIDPELRVQALVDDGDYVDADTTIWTVSGSARSILMAERTALNFVQRMSGTATLARTFVDQLPDGTTTRIADTRKTTPLLRYLQRYAVRTGGAHNHRDMLGSAVMIKDNHIAAAGGIEPAIARAKARAPHTCRIEIEVENLSMLEQALSAGADIVMLDNFAPDHVAQAVVMARGKATVEISGNMTPERVRSAAVAGVDVISVGALTHSAPAADISLRFKL